MGGSRNELILAVEIMKYMGWSYDDFMNTPYEIVQAVLIRMDLESKIK